MRQARLERGITQSELASAARVGANYIPRLERGELVPSVETAFRIARALGVSLDELCGRGAPRRRGSAVSKMLLRLGRTDVAALRRVVEALESVSPVPRKIPIRRAR